MRWTKKKNRLALAATAFLAGGTVLQSNCANALYSLPICGTVLTFCTPSDQLNILFPLLETPDFSTDPTCTIPLGCGAGDENFRFCVFGHGQSLSCWFFVISSHITWPLGVETLVECRSEAEVYRNRGAGRLASRLRGNRLRYPTSALLCENESDMWLVKQ